MKPKPQPKAKASPHTTNGAPGNPKTTPQRVVFTPPTGLPPAMACLIIAPGRERSIIRRHPWVYSGAVARLKVPHKAELIDGDVVAVCSAEGAILGFGHYHPNSQIRCRIFAFGEEVVQDFGAEFWLARFRSAAQRRKRYPTLQNSNAYRLINAEGDGAPGIVVDVYNQAAVAQLRTAGVQSLMPVLQQFVSKELGIKNLILRPEDAEAQHVIGDANEAVFTENGLQFIADLIQGQKTGFFLDQRENRVLAGAYAKGKRVLNAFSYSGGFGLYALAGGAAQVTSVDISAKANELCARNTALNFKKPDAERHQILTADCFEYLRSLDTGAYEMIILDPPAFTKHISTVEKAARGYKDINLRALKLLPPGGLLLTFSCSQHVSPTLFRQILFGAAVDSGRAVRVLAVLGHAPDHPIDLYHPEGEYLKGLLLQVD